METIISYLDNLFRNYPDTPQVRKAREELLGIMEDKYHELKAEGRQEHEVIGIVISEFGNMEEIAPELGEAKVVLEKSAVKEKKDDVKTIQVNWPRAEQYLHDKEIMGIKVSLGVSLCILSPAPSVIVETLAKIVGLPRGLADNLGGVSLFCMVAAAVALWITTGIADSKYDDWKKSRIVLHQDAKANIMALREKTDREFAVKLAAGVVLCILSVLPPMLADGIFAGGSWIWMVDFSAVSLFLLVAVGVFLIVSASVKHDAYKNLLEKQEVKEKKTKGDRWIGMIASLYWPIVTAVYLFWSFSTRNWGFTWIIWPVTGIVFGGISGVIHQICDAE